METLKDLLSNELCCCTLGVHCRPRGFSRLVLRVRFFCLVCLLFAGFLLDDGRSFLFGCLVYFCLFLMRCNSLPKCNAVICDFPCPFIVSSNLFYEIFVQFCLASFNSVLHQILFFQVF